MYQSKVENEILTRVRSLNVEQKSEVLNYLENIPSKKHSTKIYRRKAMKQIREALNKQ